MNYLVNDLIQFYSNHSSNTLKVRLSCFKVETLIIEAFNILNCLVVFGTGNNKIKTSFDVDVCRNYLITNDYILLMQVLCHLISNSVKFTKQGNIKIEAKIEFPISSKKSSTKLINKSFNRKRKIKSNHLTRNYNKTESNSYKQASPTYKMKNKPPIEVNETFLVISITDSGCGFSNEQLDYYNNYNPCHINLSNSENYNEKSGLGLGLSIAKIILNRLNAKLEINSEIDKGSQFLIHLPIGICSTSFIINEKDEKFYNEDYFEIDKDYLSEASQDESMTKKLSIKNNSFYFPNLTQEEETKQEGYYNFNNDNIHRIIENTLNTNPQNKDSLQNKESSLDSGSNITQLVNKKQSKKYHFNLRNCSRIVRCEDFYIPGINRLKCISKTITIPDSINITNLPFLLDKNDSFLLKEKNIEKFIIIVADDCSIIRQSQKKLIGDLIPKNKIIIQECCDGIDILKAVLDAKVNGNKILMIFTDENMELMNGSDAIQIINSLSDKGKVDYIPSYSVTAFEDEETKSKILSKGIKKIFSKPLRKDEVQSLLSNKISLII